jgi:hypothetical protein
MFVPTVKDDQEMHCFLASINGWCDRAKRGIVHSGQSKITLTFLALQEHCDFQSVINYGLKLV